MDIDLLYIYIDIDIDVDIDIDIDIEIYTYIYICMYVSRKTSIPQGYDLAAEASFEKPKAKAYTHTFKPAHLLLG